MKIVQVKERIENLEGDLRKASGMTAQCIHTQLSALRNIESKGITEFTEIDPEEEYANVFVPDQSKSFVGRD